MAQATKGRLNYRCPECFKRDIDMDMFYDAEKEEYYCIRCPYHGSEADVLARNEAFKGKYGRLRMRVTDFGADNVPPTFAPHKRGEK